MSDTEVAPEIRLRAADEMARIIDDWVERKIIDSRSVLADARLDYGDPFRYEAKEKHINTELLAALKAMFNAADEIAAEFIQHKRAAHWGIINEAYVQAERAIAKAERQS